MTGLEIILTTMVSLFFILMVLDDRAAKRREINLLNKLADSQKETNEWIKRFGDVEKKYNDLSRKFQKLR